jgi:phosphoesterase RecJ-like protein
MEDLIKLSEEINTAIQSSQHVLLSFHSAPDFDSIGSNLAMKLYLDSIGKKCTLISGDDAYPSATNNLPGSISIVKQKFIDVATLGIDLYLSIDTPALAKISLLPIPQTPFPFKTIVIDHHPDNPRFGDLNLIVNKSSAGEVVFELLKTWNVPITPEISKCLFLAMVSDNGSFRYPNTTSDSLRTGAALIDIGAPFREVFQLLESSENIRLKVIGVALSKLKEYLNGKVVLTTLTKEEIEKTGADPEDMRTVHKSVLHFLSQSNQSSIAIMIYDKPAGITGISLRSNNPSDPKDVSIIAEKLGGGGHKTSASVDFSGSHEEALNNVLQTIKDCYPDL